MVGRVVVYNDNIDNSESGDVLESEKECEEDYEDSLDLDAPGGAP